MIDYAAVQKALNAAGASPALATDGKWGTKSTAALTAFQRTHGLVPDGALGPKSLGALGLGAMTATPAPSKPAAASGNSSDVKAYAIAKSAAPAMPEPQVRYVLSVARGEGRYGAGWTFPPRDPVALAFAQKNGLTGTEGAGSNNWGAEQGEGDAGSFPHVDFGWKNPDGTPWNGKGPRVWLPYIGKYKRHSTPEKGFLSVAKTVLGGGKRGAAGAKEIQDAIARGDLKAAVYAQHANGYFELDPAKYFEAVTTNNAALASANGWTGILAGASAAAAGVGVVLVVGLTTALTAAAWWYFKHKGGA